MKGHFINRGVVNDEWINNVPIMTVVTSVLNKEPCIREHVELLQASFIKPHKIILINDGSTDKTAEYINEMEVDKVITHKHPKGWGASNNEALEHVDTEFVVFMDADVFIGTYGWLEHWYALNGKRDFGESGELHYCKEVFTLRGVKNFIRSCEWMNLDNKLTNDLKAAKSDINTTIHVGGNFKIFRTETLREVGGYDESMDVVNCELGISWRMRALGKEPINYRLPYRKTLTRCNGTVPKHYADMSQALEIQKKMYNATHGLLTSTYNYNENVIYCGNKRSYITWGQ